MSGPLDEASEAPRGRRSPTRRPGHRDGGRTRSRSHRHLGATCSARWRTLSDRRRASTTLRPRAARTRRPRRRVRPHRDLLYRQRIVQYMVLGELVLTPDPPGRRAPGRGLRSRRLGIRDEFGARRPTVRGGGIRPRVGRPPPERVRRPRARRGFLATAPRGHVSGTSGRPVRARVGAPGGGGNGGTVFRRAPTGVARSLRVGVVRRSRVPPPGRSPVGASAYLAQHDFVHVLADYNT